MREGLELVGYLLFAFAGIVLALGVLFSPLIVLYFILERRRRRRGPQVQEAREFQRLVRRMNRWAEPSLLLKKAANANFSKLGGDPELPVGFEWPVGENGPLIFLAQIDLEEVAAAGGPEWLPRAGRLHVFLDHDGFSQPDLVRVFHSKDEPGPPRRSPRAEFQFRERRVEFRPVTSRPSELWLNEDVSLSDSQIENILSLLADGDERPDGPRFRIGGFPDEIQGECMRVSCERIARGEAADESEHESSRSAVEAASRDWRLLLQLDSDPSLGMEWGDAGMIYAFVRREHAAKGDFSRVVGIWQAH